MPKTNTPYVDKTMKLLMISALRGLKQKEQIGELAQAEFSNNEIAQLLNTSANTVNVTRVAMRKTSKKQGRRQE